MVAFASQFFLLWSHWMHWRRGTHAIACSCLGSVASDYTLSRMLQPQIQRWGGHAVGRRQRWPLHHRERVWFHLCTSHPPLLTFSRLSSPLESEEHHSARSHREDLIKDPISTWKWNALSSVVVMMGGGRYVARVCLEVKCLHMQIGPKNLNEFRSISDLVRDAEGRKHMCRLAY